MILIQELVSLRYVGYRGESMADSKNEEFQVLFYDMIFKAGRFWRKGKENGLKVVRRKEKGIYPIPKWNGTRMVGEKQPFLKCYRGGSIFMRTRLFVL